VWEGGFDERLGGPPAGYVDLSGVGRAWDVGSAANLAKSLSDMNYKEVRTVSNEGNLTNERAVRHLQKCISGSEANPDFPRFCCISVTADRRKRVGLNPSKMDQLDNLSFYSKDLMGRYLHLQHSRECKFAGGE
jgi:hypothetical protein